MQSIEELKEQTRHARVSRELTQHSVEMLVAYIEQLEQRIETLEKQSKKRTKDTSTQS